MLSKIERAVKAKLHGGRGCPGASSIGECAIMHYLCDSVNGSGEKIYIAALYIWDKDFNDSELVAAWFTNAGAHSVEVSHVLFDSENGDRNGWTPEGSRAWTVTFTLEAPHAR